MGKWVGRSMALVNANRTTIDQNELVYRLIYFYVHNFADNKYWKKFHAFDAIHFTLFGGKKTMWLANRNIYGFNSENIHF